MIQTSITYGPLQRGSVRRFLTMLLAVCLYGALTACTEHDGPSPDDEKSVDVKLTFALPQRIVGTLDPKDTRMTGEVVQESEDAAGFRGIDDVHMFCFGTYPTASSRKLGEIIEINSLANDAIHRDSEEDYTVNHNVSIPVGTTHFTFYARASDAPSTHEERMHYGTMEAVGLRRGEYNGNGGCPAGFTSYERMFCGWLEPSVLTEPVRVVGMPALTSSPSAYILRNSGKSDEYYLFENRQKQSWDKYLGGHGMLILHVDYDSLAWAENAVNVFRSHQRMTIIPADNILYSGTLAGDTWPQPGKTELTDNSTPAAILYNPNADGNLFMNHSITEISESGDGLIGFVFDEQALGIEAVDEEGQGIKDNAIYNLSGVKMNKENVPSGIYIQNGKKRIAP